LLLLVPCSPIVWTQQVRSTFVHNCAWKFHSSALDSVPMCIQVYSTMPQVHPTLSRCTQLHPSAFNCAQVHCYMPKVGIAHNLSKGACYARSVSYNNAKVSKHDSSWHQPFKVSKHDSSWYQPFKVSISGTYICFLLI